jgi:heme oxygenase
MLSAPARISDVRHQLRTASTEAHARVDAAFSKFDMSDARGYEHLLRAFCRVVPALEARLAGHATWSGWSPRAFLLFADLATFHTEDMELADRVPDILAASPWAIQYVLEGSRLGGRILARRVGAGMPAAYLSAFIPPPDWLRFQSELQVEAEANDAVWLDHTIDATLLAFAMFEEAAKAEFTQMRQRPEPVLDPAPSVSSHW